MDISLFLVVNLINIHIRNENKTRRYGMLPFIGRKEELKALKQLFDKNAASMIVIKGRRRIGKSRLVEEFAKNYIYFHFSGIFPTQDTTEQSQRNEFSRQLSIQTGLPEVYADDWSKLFLLLNEKIKHGKIVVLFDEISWMGSKDSDFLGKLKNAWDLYFKKNQNLILVLCGSASAWIEKNILSSTGFVGRISYRLTLEELGISEANQFWTDKSGHISAYEKLKILSVTGGIPRYLEEIKPQLSAEENIKQMCFIKGGALVNEFDEIFSDLFSNRSPTYRKIIETLANGPLEIKDITTKLGIEQSGFISEYLNDLILSGFISRDYTWSIATGDMSRLSHFRLSDNYIRFYLKYVMKNRKKIDNNGFAFKSLTNLPGWESIMGFQFENLILKNREIIRDALNIAHEDVVSDNPFFQRPSTKQKGCQIDYLIQTKHQGLYVCEIKFSKHEVPFSIISEMKQKIDRLHRPKGFSCRPVLIHVNGVHEDVIESDYFAYIIDFSKFLI